MEEHTLPARLECPSCGNSSFATGPDCGTVYAPGARYCPSCGADLVRECPACGADNPHPVRRCTACGQELEMLEALFARATSATADWLQQQRDKAPAIKAQQEAESQARLAKMWAVEECRREELVRAQSERDRQQEIIVTATVVIVAVLVIAALVVVALTVSRTPSPHFYPFQ